KESWPSLPHNRGAVVRTSLKIHARAKSNLAQKLDRASLQNASANSFLHMGAAVPFQHDGVDAISVENMGQQQAGWATANDCYLGSRGHQRHCQRGMSPRGNANYRKLASACQTWPQARLRQHRGWATARLD